MLSFILSIFPIVLLIYLMVKRNALPSYVALPWVATLVMGVHLYTLIQILSLLVQMLFLQLLRYKLLLQ